MMLTPDQIEALGEISSTLLDPIIDYLLSDIATRISEAGQITNTASYEIWKLQTLGNSQRQTKKELRKRLKISHQRLRQLFTLAAQRDYEQDIQRFPFVQAIPFRENTSLQQILNAAVEQAQEGITNITQTMGFVEANGQFVGLTDAYRQASDFAFMKTVTGAQDYNSAIRDALRGLREQGIQTIDYDSGVHTSVEAAVRRNVMSSLGIMQEQISQSDHDVLGCNGWEISAHSASAPDHEPIQGRQYTDAEYKRLNDSLKRRIGTLNCGHSAFPIILGINSPQYTPEELAQMRQENEKGVTVEGRHYSQYEATQKQRAMERGIRKRKHQILVDKGAGDAELLQTDQIRLVRQREEYNRFSKAAGLRPQYERQEAAGFTWKDAREAERAARSAEKATKNGDATPTTSKNGAGGGQQGESGIQMQIPGFGSNAGTPLASATPPASGTPGGSSGQPGYTDITGAWFPDAVPGSHEVLDAQEVTVDGITYKVDGRKVQLSYSRHEKEIAELLEREVGGELFMLPKVNDPQGIRTADYIFHGIEYDLKTLEKKENSGKNRIFNRVKKSRKQAHNFIVDITDAELDNAVVEEQIEKIFWSGDTKFVKELVIIKNMKIVGVYSRV